MRVQLPPPGSAGPVPSPFTGDDYADRMIGTANAAAEAGLDGVLVAPGPDLVWLTGYRPPVTERLTMLILAADHAPVLVVPRLERPAARLRPDGDYAISDNAWAMHLLGLQQALPRSSYRSLTQCLPKLRGQRTNASWPGSLRRGRTRATASSSFTGPDTASG